LLCLALRQPTKEQVLLSIGKVMLMCCPETLLSVIWQGAETRRDFRAKTEDKKETFAGAHFLSFEENFYRHTCEIIILSVFVYISPISNF